jgi:hypothetical protein
LSPRPVSKWKIVRAAESNELLRVEADRFEDHALSFRRGHVALNIFLPLIKCRVKFVPVIHDGPEALVILATRRQKKMPHSEPLFPGALVPSLALGTVNGFAKVAVSQLTDRNL